MLPDRSAKTVAALGSPTYSHIDHAHIVVIVVRSTAEASLKVSRLSIVISRARQMLLFALLVVTLADQLSRKRGKFVYEKSEAVESSFYSVPCNGEV